MEGRDLVDGDGGGVGAEEATAEGGAGDRDGDSGGHCGRERRKGGWGWVRQSEVWFSRGVEVDEEERTFVIGLLLLLLLLLLLSSRSGAPTPSSAYSAGLALDLTMLEPVMMTTVMMMVVVSSLHLPSRQAKPPLPPRTLALTFSFTRSLTRPTNRTFPPVRYSESTPTPPSTPHTPPQQRIQLLSSSPLLYLYPTHTHLDHRHTDQPPRSDAFNLPSARPLLLQEENTGKLKSPLPPSFLHRKKKKKTTTHCTGFGKEIKKGPSSCVCALLLE